MKQFKIKPGGFKQIKRQILFRTVPIMVIAAAAGITISSVNAKGKRTDVNVLPIIIPIAAVTVGAGLYRGLSRQERLFNSFQLTLTENLISREQLNTPTISIYL